MRAGQLHRVAGLLLAGLLACGAAQAASGSIFTCVDDNGRTLTSDRPIPACNDRIQRELDGSGITKRIIQPEMTATERAAFEEHQRQERIQEQREREMARRDRALLIRYPDPQSHDAARAASQVQADVIISAATRHIQTLHQERQRLDTELEFYANDPSRIPRSLHAALERNRDAEEIALRLIADQQEERARVNAKFDEEAAYLAPFWADTEEATDAVPSESARTQPGDQ